jgi:hypothetical protein
MIQNKKWALPAAAVFAFACSAVDPETGSNAGETDAQRDLLGEVSFDDGNVVTFEALEGGIVIVESGPDGNPRHFSPEGGSAVEAFQRLAPGREVPAALKAADTRFNRPAGAIVMHQPLSAYEKDGVLDRAAVLEAAARAEQASIDEPARTGEFESDVFGAFMCTPFRSQYCNFSLVGPTDHKLCDLGVNRTDSATARKVYSAYGANIGNVTVQLCADNSCNQPYNVAQGTATSVFYDGGTKTLEVCPPFIDPRGCQVLIFDVTRKMQTKATGVSSGERYHDCGWFQ